ncbi:MAG: L-threonylcarbamoyladenylate synthase [Paracoccaceae bacterium]
MQDIKTQRLDATDDGISQAATLLSSGALVAFPTETVYGLGADARNSLAVAKVFEAKGRPHFNPLIVHVGSADEAKRFVIWSNKAQLLADAFWPGPLTLVLPLKAGHELSPLVTADLPTLAIRVPAQASAQAILSAFDGPIAAPSANPSGRISPTTCAHVIAGLEGKIAAVLDNGPCEIGLESSIVSLLANPTLLREGGVTSEQINHVLGAPLETALKDEIVSAPGQLASHYAPSAPLRLNVTSALPGEKMLGFGDIDGDFNLSPSGNLAQAAARLFDYLHQLDSTPQPIAVAPIPSSGLGRAINDRLARAAAPR